MTRPECIQIGLISNPNSGHNRDAFARIEALVAGQPAIHHIVTQCPADIEPALEVMSRITSYNVCYTKLLRYFQL